MITDVPGLRVGHWTDQAGATGCTVVLFPDRTVASGEVRGGAPATREFELLDPGRMVDRIDALVLTGGSAFGLASADGVVRFCEERGMGFATPAGPVPIVVALGLFDLMVGDASVRPGRDEGYTACVAATAGPVETGRIGAGTGATVAAASAPPPEGGVHRAARDRGAPPGPSDPARRPGGLVTATARVGDLVVASLVAVNAAGAPGADDTLALDIAQVSGGAGAGFAAAPGGDGGSSLAGFGNTVIGLVATNAALDKRDCHLVAQGAHDGLARAVFPPHTRADGDAFVTASVGGVPADVDVVRGLAVHVVAGAIRTLVRDTTPEGDRDGGR